MKDDASQRWDIQYDKGRDFGLIPSQTLTRLLGYVGPALEKTCLDLGCGTGQLTRELLHRGYSCLGIDFSASAIQLARSLTDQASRLEYRQADVEQLQPDELPRQHYSLITCKLVLAFIKDRERFMRKVYSLLVPGGVFVVVTPIYTHLKDQTPISVDFNETLALLEKEFAHVEHFEGAGDLMYFVCW